MSQAPSSAEVSSEPKSDQKETEIEEKDDFNKLLAEASTIIEIDRNKLIYHGYTPRNEVSNFISTNLPNNLQIDRSEWLNHRNWKTQTLLIRSHRNFRQSSQSLVKYCLNINIAVHSLLNNNDKNDTKTGNNNGNDDKQFLKNIGNLISQLSQSFYSINRSLSIHSNYEENKLFKYLSIRYQCPKLIEFLLQDHRKLEETELNIKKFIKKFENIFIYGKNLKKLNKTSIIDYNNKQQGNNKIEFLSNQFLINVLSFDQTLVRHLGEEESVVMPMLLELSWNEYKAYYDARSYKEALAYMPQ